MAMPTVALQQVTNPFARRNAKGTLEKPIHLKYIQRFLVDVEIRQALELVCEKGTVYIWGAKLERLSQSFKMFPRQCLFLFRQGGQINRVGVLSESIVSLELAEKLWGMDGDGETWGLIFFFREMIELSIPASEINSILGFRENNHWQGLIAKSSPEADEVIKYIKGERARQLGRMTLGNRD